MAFLMDMMEGALEGRVSIELEVKAKTERHSHSLLETLLVDWTLDRYMREISVYLWIRRRSDSRVIRAVFVVLRDWAKDE